MVLTAVINLMLDEQAVPGLPLRMQNKRTSHCVGILRKANPDLQAAGVKVVRKQQVLDSTDITESAFE